MKNAIEVFMTLALNMYIFSNVAIFTVLIHDHGKSSYLLVSFFNFFPSMF